jgi:glycyl-tRNA synthetase beta chain
VSEQLLFEIGVEELPASFLKGALDALPRLAVEELERARLGHGAIRAIGTPRRIALEIEALEDRQRDLEEKVMGPPKSAAYADDGTPKNAAVGFAKKLALRVEELVIEETDKGPYVVGRRAERGRAVREVLPQLLVDLAKRIPFPKSMRWGAGDLAFGRPIHWILCLHGNDVVPVELAGARADRRTRGHRFLAPAEISIAHARDYADALRRVHVLVLPEERKRAMEEALDRVAKEAGGERVDDAFLVEENASLVEEPHAVCGSFDPAYLSLPEEVIIQVMRGHQRYFALRAKDGSLLPRYLAVVNTSRAPENIVRGNDRALRPRLADARFFVDEDRKRTLAEHAKKLEQVVFQAKLGTVAERMQRFATLVRAFGEKDDRAALLSKADLVTLIVGEFPELQGIMGRFYALREGIAPEIADAIRDHYLPRGAGDAVPTTALSARLAIADRADALVGCFGLGLLPSGSADPYGLRRAALGIVRIALEGPIDVDVRATLAAAYEAYRAQGKTLNEETSVLGALDDFFRGRLRAFYAERHPADLVEACLGAWTGRSVRDLRARIEALEAFRRLPAYGSLAIAFKRAYNIAKDAPEGAADPTLMTEDAERALAQCFASLEGALKEAAGRGDYQRALNLVAGELRGPIDRFFDENVRVMVDDAALRDNRLRLLGGIARTVNTIAHFHLLGAEPQG